MIFETKSQGFDVGMILDAVIEIWPDALFQDAAGEDLTSLTAVLSGQPVGDLPEFFVYKDQPSAECWIKDGWTEQHGNDMAHFLVVQDAARPEILQLTLVIGSITSETVRIIEAVFEALARMSTGNPAAIGRSRRVDWDAELRAVGYTLGRDCFYEKVEELSKALFPNWTADELACHPHEALEFCEELRKSVPQVPDYLVMKALINCRKQRKKESASFEPRLFLAG